MTRKKYDFLVEVGTEELPPKALHHLEIAFSKSIGRQISEARLSYSGIESFATPRRLSVLLNQLDFKQANRKIERRGPPVKIAFDKNGAPTEAAEKFAIGNGVSLKDLERLQTKKGEYLLFKGEEIGKTIEELLPKIVEIALQDLPIPRRMRWGSSDFEFVRPVHWLVMLADEKIIKAEILGCQSERSTYGHRFHAPHSIEISSASEYSNLLLKNGKVIASFLNRKQRVLEMAENAATENNGYVSIDDGLLDEVTALVEWPVPVVGSFDHRFLDLPSEVLISTLQEHQRYFPIHNNNGGLTNKFITISNLESIDPGQVKLGNERVVLPRLSDAAFFWEQDLKTPPDSLLSKLDSVVYQKGLGTLKDKSERVATVAAGIAEAIGVPSIDVKRAANLAKTDLLTEMVAEFPDLQGRMGFYYAAKAGEKLAISNAIKEQYLPRYAGDALPETCDGQLLSIADRIDTLAGIFALKKRPTGSKDPFALRRIALGLVRILIETQIDIDLVAAINQALQIQPAKVVADTNKDLYEFITERLKAYYLDGLNPAFNNIVISAEQFEAVRQCKPSSPLDFHQRLKAVVEFSLLEESESLASANKRIANILKSASIDNDIAVKEELLLDSVEIQLYHELKRIEVSHNAAISKHQYSAVLKALSVLKGPVDAFFDTVMVNVDDSALRINRIALLTRLRGLFLDVADLSSL
jgi:glycyl-tRNA synthetase beta chain